MCVFHKEIQDDSGLNFFFSTHMAFILALTGCFEPFVNKSFFSIKLPASQILPEDIRHIWRTFRFIPHKHLLSNFAFSLH